MHVAGAQRLVEPVAISNRDGIRDSVYLFVVFVVIVVFDDMKPVSVLEKGIGIARIVCVVIIYESLKEMPAVSADRVAL